MPWLRRPEALTWNPRQEAREPRTLRQLRLHVEALEDAINRVGQAVAARESLS